MKSNLKEAKKKGFQNGTQFPRASGEDRDPQSKNGVSSTEETKKSS